MVKAGVGCLPKYEGWNAKKGSDEEQKEDANMDTTNWTEKVSTDKQIAKPIIESCELKGRNKHDSLSAGCFKEK